MRMNCSSANNDISIVGYNETEREQHAAATAAAATAAQDQLQSLLFRQALKVYRVEDYLFDFSYPQVSTTSSTSSSSSSSATQLETRKRSTTATTTQSHAAAWTLSAKHRRMVGEWFYEVLEHFHYPPRFAAIAMHYFDRACLSKNMTVHVPYELHEIQLLSLVCIYLALKLFYHGPCLSLEHMSRMSAGIFSVKQLERMERRVLVGLKWFVHPPLAHDFLVTYMHLLECKYSFGIISSSSGDAMTTFATNSRVFRDDENNTGGNNSKTNEDMLHHLYKIASSILQRSVLDYYFVECGHDPSVVAMAALLHAEHLVCVDDGSKKNNDMLFHYFDSIPGVYMKWTRVDDCRQRFLFQDAKNNSNHASTTLSSHCRSKQPASTAMLVASNTTANKARRMDSPLSVVAEATKYVMR